MLRPAGKTAYLTIGVSPGLGKRAHRLAVRLGPRAVGSRRPLAEMMTAAGFVDLEITDVTQDFLGTARAWTAGFVRHERELKEVLGDEWEERQADRRDLIRGIEEGLLRRLLVSAAAQPARA